MLPVSLVPHALLGCMEMLEGDKTDVVDLWSGNAGPKAFRRSALGKES